MLRYKKDYKNKYQAGSTVETCPAPLGEEITKKMQEMKNVDQRLQRIGWNIRSLRESKGYTIEYMAELAKVSPAHIQRIETSNKGVSLPCLYRIADALHVSLGYLIELDRITGNFELSDVFQEGMGIEELMFWKEVISCCKQIMKKYNI